MSVFKAVIGKPIKQRSSHAERVAYFDTYYSDPGFADVTKIKGSFAAPEQFEITWEMLEHLMGLQESGFFSPQEVEALLERKGVEV